MGAVSRVRLLLLLAHCLPLDLAGNVSSTEHHEGVVLLSMHRSGSSLLAGLLTRMGLHVGSSEETVGGNRRNKYGYFERWDVIRQNNLLLGLQGLQWNNGTAEYDPEVGVKATSTKSLFVNGRSAMVFFNHPDHQPFVMKDPRLCITLRTWIPLFGSRPAVVFSFRHPLDVALSLHRRNRLPVVAGLRLWYVYNRRAVQQSQDLCRVVSSNRLLLMEPTVEVDRIYRELREGCGVDVPRALPVEEVRAFVDLEEQHGRAGLAEGICPSEVPGAPSDWPEARPEELEVLRVALEAYCAMEGGAAFDRFYEWNENVSDSSSQ